MTLSEATTRECDLMACVGQATGLIEEKTAQLQKNGTFAAYCSLLDRYLELASDAADGVEALKRAVFIAWYEEASPACFSGIAGITSQQRSAVLRALNDVVEQSPMDDELEWMLPWYYFIADYAFPHLEQYPAVERILAAPNSHAWEQLGLRAEQFVGRGRMGEYWASVIRTSADQQQ